MKYILCIYIFYIKLSAPFICIFSEYLYIYTCIYINKHIHGRRYSDTEICKLGHTETQTYRDTHTYRQTHRQKNRQNERERDRETYQKKSGALIMNVCGCVCVCVCVINVCVCVRVCACVCVCVFHKCAHHPDTCKKLLPSLSHTHTHTHSQT